MDYKKLPNEVGGKETTPPEAVPAAMETLFAKYNAEKEKTLDDLLDFRCQFER